MTENLLSLRPMLSSDLSKVVAVENAAYSIPWTKAIFEDCLLSSSNKCWMLCLDGHVVGHSVISDVLDETHLLNLCIDPRFGRKGYGRWMLRTLIQHAIGRDSMMFFLEVRQSNTVAINLYLSEGFNETGLRKNYYPAKTGREDAVLMSLDLRINTYA